MPVKAIRGPLWRYAHPFKHLAGEYRKARRAMRPRKVVARVFSLDQVARALGTQTTRANEKTRRKQVAKSAPRKTAAKKTAAKKTAAKKTAAKAAPRKTAAAKTTVVRKKNGQFNGREAMDPRERAMFERAENRQTDPDLLPRSPGSAPRRAG